MGSNEIHLKKSISTLEPRCALPAAVVVVAIGDIIDHGQVVIVVNIGSTLEEELGHVGVASAGRHGQNAGAEAVSAVDLCTVL